MQAEQTSFLFGANAPFIEELYARFLEDPNKVDPRLHEIMTTVGPFSQRVTS